MPKFTCAHFAFSFMLLRTLDMQMQERRKWVKAGERQRTMISPLFHETAARPSCRSARGRGSSAGSRRAAAPRWRRCIQTEWQGWVLCTAPWPARTSGPPTGPHSSWSETGDRRGRKRGKEREFWLITFTSRMSITQQHTQVGQMTFNELSGIKLITDEVVFVRPSRHIKIYYWLLPTHTHTHTGQPCSICWKHKQWQVFLWCCWAWCLEKTLSFSWEIKRWWFVHFCNANTLDLGQE